MTRILTICEAGENMTATADGEVPFYVPVVPTAKKKVEVATGPNYVGVCIPNDGDSSLHGETYPDGKLLNYVARGAIRVMKFGGNVTVKSFLKFTTGGKLVAEADPAVKTGDTVAIAMEAGSDGTEGEVMFI